LPIRLRFEPDSDLRSWEGVSLEEFIKELVRYIRWYNEKRIKMRLGAMSPMDYRRGLGLVA